MFEQSWRPGLTRSRSESDGGLSHPDGQSLAEGHLKDSSIGGLSFEPPVDLSTDTGVCVKRSRITSRGVVRHPAIQWKGSSAPHRWSSVARTAVRVANILTQSSV